MRPASNEIQLLETVFVGGGLLMIVLAIPLILRRVKPNYWYGFRTRKTLTNERVWYAVNAHAGWRLLISGIFITFAAIGLALVPGISVDAYSLLVLVVVVITLGIGLGQSFAYLKGLEK